LATVIAYVDGFNLYHGLRAKYQHRYLCLDPGRLVQRIRPADHILAVRYFPPWSGTTVPRWPGRRTTCPR
jgi:hypothetical protein